MKSALPEKILKGKENIKPNSIPITLMMKKSQYLQPDTKLNSSIHTKYNNTS